jgi:hypothetical protein
LELNSISDNLEYFKKSEQSNFILATLENVLVDDDENYDLEFGVPSKKNKILYGDELY